MVEWPDDKLPSIGILYEEEHLLGDSENDNLLQVSKHFNFLIRLAFFKQSRHLRLFSKAVLEIR